MEQYRLPEKRVMMLSPKYLGGAFALFVLLFLGTALFEYHYRKSEIEHIMREEAALLMHALSEGAENAITGYTENSSLLTGSLIDQLRLLDRLDKQHELTSKELSAIAGSSGIYRVNIFDSKGKRIAFNSPPDHTPLLRQCDSRLYLQPIFSGQKDSLLLGIRQSSSDRGPRLIAAVKRSRGGVIAGNVDATRLLDLRRKLGVGQLIERIGADSTGIDYIIWQDSTGILAATPNVSKTASVRSDAFLESAMLTRKPLTRMTTFEGRTVFEVVNSFYYGSANVGLLRIGLKNDHFSAALDKLRNRFFMLFALVAIGGLVMFNLVISRRNETVIKDAYQRVQTFSSTILESMADAVLTVDGAGSVTLVNRPAEKLLRVSSGEATGKPVQAVFPECAQFLSGIMDEGSEAAFNREFLCHAGDQERLLAGNFSRITGSGESILGAVAVLRDLTEERAMQQVIDRQEKLSAIGELASGVAHEIRNPLNAIGILAQRLDIEFSPAADEPEYRHLVRTVVSEVHRVNAIIQRFLKFGRPPQLMPVPVNLDDFVGSYSTVLQSEAEKKGVRFTLDAGCRKTVQLDREQMQQVLLNIVRNSVEATAEGGHIALRVFCRGSQAVIEVADTGAGIPAAKLPEIFNLYYTTKDDGTGMGLSIANQIVHVHGGMIEVSSREGEGSVFRVVLPAV
ncbi:MAG: PAS domain-containing protein [Chlorobium sp.]|uniref:ATP-binding protein n=1 Tax=Chlorobium sp. TaxID=1095 RepID=UPI0025BAE593|nr:ATP-binding protein [Chlorobium sp.]MCF8383822.1 PAS domain-containing protein [Chlorobium sp.]